MGLLKKLFSKSDVNEIIGTSSTSILGVAIRKAIANQVQYVCTKHSDCPDTVSFCCRKTDEPCCFRKVRQDYDKWVSRIESYKETGLWK